MSYEFLPTNSTNEHELFLSLSLIRADSCDSWAKIHNWQLGLISKVGKLRITYLQPCGNCPLASALTSTSANHSPSRYYRRELRNRFGGRFIYINIGSYAGQINTQWNRRLKIPLIGITQSQIDEILKTPGVLETSVPGTGKDGGSNCATLKPFAGWSVVQNYIVT